jgi:hypothetical protein
MAKHAACRYRDSMLEGDRERVVAVFVTDGEARRVLVVEQGPRLAALGGPVAAGEHPGDAARRIAGAGAELVAAGLAVDVDEVASRKIARRRVHPFLFRGAAERGGGAEEPRWVEPDELILLAAIGETTGELDEILARVWDPPAQLPPIFRDEARAIAAADPSAAGELALRGAALVRAGAPAERVAALQPVLAAFVNAVRVAAVPGRDVFPELVDAENASTVALAARLRPGMPVVLVNPTRPILAAVAEAKAVVGEEGDLVLLGADAVLRSGDVVARAALPGGDAPVLLVADAWRNWADDVPPLGPGSQVIPATRIAERI